MKSVFNPWPSWGEKPAPFLYVFSNLQAQKYFSEYVAIKETKSLIL
jgi:hypothetical protein